MLLELGQGQFARVLPTRASHRFPKPSDPILPLPSPPPAAAGAASLLETRGSRASRGRHGMHAYKDEYVAVRISTFCGYRVRAHRPLAHPEFCSGRPAKSSRVPCHACKGDPSFERVPDPCLSVVVAPPLGLVGDFTPQPWEKRVRTTVIQAWERHRPGVFASPPPTPQPPVRLRHSHARLFPPLPAPGGSWRCRAQHVRVSTRSRTNARSSWHGQLQLSSCSGVMLWRGRRGQGSWLT